MALLSYIKDAGWIDGEFSEEVKYIDDIDPEDERYQYFNEALEDGSTFVFCEYPKKESDLDLH